jgi:hypothetical protein
MRLTLTASQTAIATLLLCLSWMTVRGYSDIFFRDTGVDMGTRVISVLYPPMGQDENEADVFGTLNIIRGGNPNIRAAAFDRMNLFRDANWRLASAIAYEKQQMATPGSNYIENSLFYTVHASPGFFKTLGVKIIAGRDFNEKDLRGREIIVNEALVRKMGWTLHEAIGRETAYQRSDNATGTIIGVCGDFLTASYDSDILPEFYTPMDDDGRMRGGILVGATIHYVIHPDDLPRVGNIEKAVRSVHPDAEVKLNSTWDEALGATVRGRTFATFSITLFAVAGIAIVITGIVGTITFIVKRRKRDIAIQLAVGAPSYRVCWFVMKDMVIAGVAGALAGGIASWWAGKAVAHYVYPGAKYQNLTGLAIAAVIMLAIIAAAALLPALHALRVEPGRILNSE